VTKRAASVTSSEPGPAAVAQLVEANLRLVVSYAHRFHGCGLSLIDLIHAGNLGLIEAARRYDHSAGTTFVSYASWWVRQAMVHALADRKSAHPMPASVLATPTANRVASLVPTALDADDVLDELYELEDADFDETFEEIQSRANGAPRHVDRLRSHLN
jgi:RNA polymerase sigma factor (sigma-70 family)